jgi:hypothetical protein
LIQEAKHHEVDVRCMAGLEQEPAQRMVMFARHGTRKYICPRISPAHMRLYAQTVYAPAKTPLALMKEQRYLESQRHPYKGPA